MLDPNIPTLSPSPPPTGSDLPLSVDTDAEAAFSHGSRWFFRRGRADISSPYGGEGSLGTTSADPLTSSSIRRKWAEDLLDLPHTNSKEKNLGEERFEESRPGSVSPADREYNTKSFLSRLHRNSLSGLTLTFSKEHKHASTRDTSAEVGIENTWSSDSSSSDELSFENRAYL
jgi:hypothetical protein